MKFVGDEGRVVDRVSCRGDPFGMPVEPGVNYIDQVIGRIDRWGLVLVPPVVSLSLSKQMISPVNSEAELAASLVSAKRRLVSPKCSGALLDYQAGAEDSPAGFQNPK
jgi:hypothetical protein